MSIDNFQKDKIDALIMGTSKKVGLVMGGFGTYCLILSLNCFTTYTHFKTEFELTKSLVQFYCVISPKGMCSILLRLQHLQKREPLDLFRRHSGQAEQHRKSLLTAGMPCEQQDLPLEQGSFHAPHQPQDLTSGGMENKQAFKHFSTL